MKIILSHAASFSQLGQRSNQEDARFPDCDSPNLDNGFYVVCDGVGGHDFGEIASRTVSNAIAEYMQDEDLEQPFSIEDFQLALGSAYVALYKAMKQAGNYSMATTLTFIAFHSKGCTIAHMGDSRVYHVRPGAGVLYRTSDHSLVNEMVRSGNMLPEEASTSSIKNYITRCLAYVEEGREFPKATIYETNNVRPGDVFFLCTDGVLDKIPEDELVQLLANPEGTPDDKMPLIAMEASDSHDNNTATMLQVGSVISDAGALVEQLPQSSVPDPALNPPKEFGPLFPKNNLFSKIDKFLDSL